MAELKRTHDPKRLEISRGPGNGTSFWGDTPIDLPDEGARISFVEFEYSKNFILHIHFGYTSPSFKDYSRSIQLDLRQTIQLNRFLTDRINQQAMHNQYLHMFAYGSNMASFRLKNRIDSARKEKIARLISYKLVFNKKSKDESVKANIIKTGDPNDFVWGVVYEISKSDKLELDKFEGTGYQAVEIEIVDEKNLYSKAQTYIATPADTVTVDDTPYDWYKEYILAGAEENGLPDEYINSLKTIKCKIDTDEERRTTNLETVRASRQQRV